MEVVAKSRYVRCSPRKLRLVASAVKKLSLDEAVTLLENSPKQASLPLLKVVKQGVANATKNLSLERAALKIKKIEVSEGPTYKRWRAVSRGRAHGIAKRTSHITVILEGEEKGEKRAAKRQKVKKQKEKKGVEGKKDGTKS